MCFIKIKDILFPFNFFGKKMQSVEYKLPAGGDTHITAIWSGERLQLAYKSIRIDRLLRKTTSANIIAQETNGDDLDEDITRGSHGHSNYFVGSTNSNSSAYDKVYFKCTNVTHLEVNGTVLIS